MNFKNIKRITFLLIIFICMSLVNAYATYTRGNIKVKNVTTNISDEETLISNENELGVVTDAVVYSKPTSIYEFLDENNAYNLVYATESTIYWSTFNDAMTITKTYTTEVIYNKDNVEKELQDLTFTVGGYTYYKEKLYVVYARAPKDMEENALAIVKYNKKLKEVDRIEVKAKDINSSAYYEKGGMSFPFYGANCSVAVNPKTGVLSVLLGKNRFDGNQDSSILFFDTNNMRWISDKINTSKNSDIPYRLASTHSVKHSLGQRVIATSNGGFLLAESGDSYKTRGLNITQIMPSRKEPVESKIMFHYKEGKNTVYGNNSTYQALGNIIELDDGYLYVGASEKTLDTNYGNTINESWNLFAQKYKKIDFQNKMPENLQMFDEPLRETSKAWPKEETGKLFLEGTEVDYGVKWLTDLGNTSSVVFVRAIEIEDDDVVIIWQEAEIKPNKKGGFDYDEEKLTAYYMIIDSKGEIKTPKTIIEYAGKLSVEEQYVYKNGKIYWATASGKSENITIHILNLDNPYTHTFTDVKPQDWYSDSVQYVYKENIMCGYNDTKFAPNDKCTKEMMLLNIYNMATKPEVLENSKSQENYNKAVQWALNNGIISDTTNVDEEITRQDITVLLYKYTKYKRQDVSKTPDISVYKDYWNIQDYAVKAMKWGVAKEIIKGNSDKMLLPQETATRAEVASILINYCNVVGK
ncbi:MAG: S-layer homology domain-containing protein [Clostridia bacterium]|nr:S-layer homology domain-containing protein [Clostridia bacterium]